MKSKVSTLSAAGLAVLCSLFSSAAQAKDVGRYSVTFQPQSSRVTQFQEIYSLLSGWRCYGSAGVTFREEHRNSHGVREMIPMEHKSDFRFSLFDVSGPMRMNFDRNMTIANGELELGLTEYCSRTVEVEDTCTDQEGRRYRCTSTETETLNLYWECPIEQIPGTAGTSVRTTCRPGRSFFSSHFSFEGMMLAMFREKTFNADIRMDSLSHQFARTTCTGDRSNRVVVQLQQGADIWSGEDDLVFHVNVNGMRFDVRSPNGILDEEVELCNAGENIHVRVSATEEDVIFDDVYRPNQTLRVSRRYPSNWGKISLAEDGGEFDDGEVMVIVREASLRR